MNISCICCDHIEKHVQARLIYRKSSQVNRTQKNMEQHKKHTDFHHTVDGRNAASASWGCSSLSHYLRGFTHIHCWRISSITSIYMIGSLTVILGSGRFPNYCHVDLLASTELGFEVWNLVGIRTMKTKSQVRPIDCHLLLTRPMDARVVYQFDSICWSNINGCWYGINIKLIKMMKLLEMWFFLFPSAVMTFSLAGRLWVNR